MDAKSPHVVFPAQNPPSQSVVTSLMIHNDLIISASDDHSIHIFSPATGERLQSLQGHKGGVWAIDAYKNTVVSGSTDRTLRIWELSSGLCTHVFGGHTSTVRCAVIVKPEWVHTNLDDESSSKEKWPKQPLIVTGSRDGSLRVWSLPKLGEPEYSCFKSKEEEENGLDDDYDVAKNPYHLLHLEGHEGAVRAIATGGRTLVSGSYDKTARVWDLVTGECKFVLKGHTGKIYSLALDLSHNQVFSGSIDCTVRCWDLKTGQCQLMEGHTSLVGLLQASPSSLVSGCADGTLRVWDPQTATLRRKLDGNSGAICTFQHDDFRIVAGMAGYLKVWDIRDGGLVTTLLPRPSHDIIGVWNVAFRGRWCVAACEQAGQTSMFVWDFEGGEGWHGEVYDAAVASDDEETLNSVVPS